MRNLQFILVLALPTSTFYYDPSGYSSPWTKDKDRARRFTIGERSRIHFDRFDTELVARFGRWSRDKKASVTPVARERYDGRLYVNVYHRDRAYGGPEEGGWWYDCGTPCGGYPSQRFYRNRSAQEAANKLNADFREQAKVRGSRGDYSSVLFAGDLVAHVEQHRARPYPQVTPHYE